MKFIFKAKDKEGKEIEGEREGRDRFTLARELKVEELTPLSIRAMTTDGSKGWRRWKDISIFGRVKPRDMIVFAGNLSAMISAGLSLARALEVIRRETSSKAFGQVVGQLSDKIRVGQSFNSALAEFPKVFPPVFTAMVAAGEESGRLPQALDVVGEQMMRSYELRRRVRGAMIYPIIIIGAIIIIAILMMIYLVPNLTAIFSELEVELPFSTKVVIGVSNFLSQHTLSFLLMVVLVGLGLAKFSRTRAGRRSFAWLWLRFPVIKTVIRQFNSAITMRTLSSLIAAGVGMVQSLKITERVLQNDYYREVVGSAGERVEKGQPLSTLFKEHENIYPPLVGEMVEVGEETGKLSEMLQKGAVFYEAEVAQATKNLSTIIEPVLMILIGLAVGFFAVSMIGPIYSLSSNL